MKEKTKAKIKGIVKAYIKLFPVEYELVKDFIKQNRQKLNNEFAAVTGDHVLKRSLYEIPEKLQAMLDNQLDDVELLEFRTLKGGRWFAKTFKEFSVSGIS